MHAGESSGPEGVRDSIELLDAYRIDHGVRAIEDLRTVARNSIDASFANADVKAGLLEALARW